MTLRTTKNSTQPVVSSASKQPSTKRKAAQVQAENDEEDEEDNNTPPPAKKRAPRQKKPAESQKKSTGNITLTPEQLQQFQEYLASQNTGGLPKQSAAQLKEAQSKCTSI